MLGFHYIALTLIYIHRVKREHYINTLKEQTKHTANL